MIEQWHGGDRFHVFFARAIGDGVGEFIQQDVRFAIQHAIALLNRGLPDGLCQVAFARASGTEEQSIFALADERGGGQIEDQAAIHFRIEGEVEVIERAVASRKPACLRRRSSKRSERRVSSSETRHEIRSMGGIDSACAWRKRVSSTAAMPPRRSCVSARWSSIRFMGCFLV